MPCACMRVCACVCVQVIDFTVNEKGQTTPIVMFHNGTTEHIDPLLFDCELPDGKCFREQVRQSAHSSVEFYRAMSARRSHASQNQRMMYHALSPTRYHALNRTYDVPCTAEVL